MKTKFLKTSGPVRARNIRTAAQLIRGGGLVAFPTETVYGLGASTFSIRAVKEIFRVKGRPQDNPLIVHVWSFDQAWILARSIPVMFWVLAEHFLPGPLTMVLKKSDRVPDIVTAGLDTVAIRFPDHPIARALLREAGVPIVAPSANLSGAPSPTTAQHVGEDLDGKIAAILDGGPCKIGVESTVLDITHRLPVILRPGGVTREQLEEVLRMRIRVARTTHLRPASPGMKYRHYAPKAEVVLFEGKAKLALRAMKTYAEQASGRGMRVGVMAEGPASAAFSKYHFVSLGTSGAASAANRLFDAFRILDRRNVSAILCQGFSEEAIGSALMNRLRKAASRRIRV